MKKSRELARIKTMNREMTYALIEKPSQSFRKQSKFIMA